MISINECKNFEFNLYHSRLFYCIVINLFVNSCKTTYNQLKIWIKWDISKFYAIDSLKLKFLLCFIINC